MIEHYKKMVMGQFEAALCMFDDCVRKCMDEHWDGKVAKHPFWQVAYHALCFVDLYLSPSKDAYQPREIHPKGWDEFKNESPSRRFEKAEILGYLAICRQKLAETIGAETAESLERPSGFDWLPFTRGELHLYNMRHIQHHTGQLGAYLRRVDKGLQERAAVRWVRTGWQV